MKRYGFRFFWFVCIGAFTVFVHSCSNAELADDPIDAGMDANCGDATINNLDQNEPAHVWCDGGF